MGVRTAASGCSAVAMVAGVRWVRVLALPGLLGACSALGEVDDPAIRVQRVRVLGGEVGARAHEGEWVRKAAERALAASPRFRIDAGSGRIAALSYSDVQTTAGAMLRLELAIEDAAERARGDLSATILLERSARSPDLTRDLPVAIERAVAVLEAKAGLRARDAEVAIALLEGDDPELELLALAWIAREQRTDLREAVRAELDDADIEVAKAAIDCLAAIGTDADAAALVAASRLADRDHTERLYAALGTLGGDAAVGFLAFAAENEDDTALAKQARSALDRARSQDGGERSRPRIARGHR